jgi:hypothetical protein
MKLAALAVLAAFAASVLPPTGARAAEAPASSSPPAAEAAPSKAPSATIDFVTIQNGDRISGEIKSYEEGRLLLSAPEGDINIKWNKIQSIQSSKVFEIETTTGDHFLGTLAPSEPPGRLLLVVEGGPPRAFDFFDVVRITPIFQTFFRRIDGSFDLGANYTHASDLLQFNVSSDLVYKKPKFAVLTDLSLFYSRQDGETTSQRGTLKFTYLALRPHRWVYGSLVGFENNRDLGLQLRSTVGLFVGRFLVLKNQTNVILTAGLLGNHESGTSGEVANNLEGAVDARYSTFTYDYPKIWFDAYLRLIPGITDAPRFRVDADVKLKREIVVKDLYLAVSIFYNYDSVPPSTHAVKSDWGPVISIGWTF